MYDRNEQTLSGSVVQNVQNVLHGSDSVRVALKIKLSD